MAMSGKSFDEPRIALNRIYTRRGDQGETSLSGGQRVPKDSLRIECYGTVDELNSFVGIARVSAEESGLLSLVAILRRVQQEVVNLGCIRATRPGEFHPKQTRITPPECAQ